MTRDQREGSYVVSFFHSVYVCTQKIDKSLFKRFQNKTDSVEVNQIKLNSRNRIIKNPESAKQI